MFNNLFGKSSKSTKRIYLAGWEVQFNGDQQCHNFIATQITNKATVLKVDHGIELVFENEKLKKAFDHEEGDIDERELSGDEIGFQYVEYPENRLYSLALDQNGLHQLGGELPEDFNFPENDCAVPFQYLGFINNEDRLFNWLPFKLHLTCPVYLNIHNVFLDYSVPNNPILLNREEVENVDTAYEELKKDSEIVFYPGKFSCVDYDEFSQTGNSGIPLWIQYPAIPMCPKSGKRMKFVCQLNGGVSALRTNVIPSTENYRHYFEELNFWGDGNLFVFFEPTSKVACYFIQNT